MNVSDLSWVHVIAFVVLYLMATVGTWIFRTSRPEAQARARQRAFAGSSLDPATGEMTMTFAQAINLNRIAAVLIVPPLLFVIGWLVARG